MEDEQNDPRSTFDAVAGWVVNAFAAIGVTATLAAIVGYFWSR